MPGGKEDGKKKGKGGRHRKGKRLKMSGGNRKLKKEKATMERRRRGGLDFSSRFPRPDHMKEIAEEENKCRCRHYTFEHEPAVGKGGWGSAPPT